MKKSSERDKLKISDSIIPLSYIVNPRNVINDNIDIKLCDENEDNCDGMKNNGLKDHLLQYLQIQPCTRVLPEKTREDSNIYADSKLFDNITMESQNLHSDSLSFSQENICESESLTSSDKNGSNQQNSFDSCQIVTSVEDNKGIFSIHEAGSDQLNHKSVQENPRVRLSEEVLDCSRELQKEVNHNIKQFESTNIEAINFCHVVVKQEADEERDFSMLKAQNSMSDDCDEKETHLDKIDSSGKLGDPEIQKPCEVVIKVEHDMLLEEEPDDFPNDDGDYNEESGIAEASPTSELPFHVNFEEVNEAPETGSRDYPATHSVSSEKCDQNHAESPVSRDEEEEMVKVMQQGISGEFFCTICGKRAKDPNYITDDEILFCECKTRYGVPTKTSHNGYYIRYMGKWTCQVCGKQYSAKSDLAKHMPLHNSERRYKCELCGKCFILEEHLTKHLVMHNSEKKFECAKCGKRFVLLIHLSRHLWAHSQEKEHVCEECGKCFRQKCHLSRHMVVIHTTRRKNICDTCGKSFNSPAILSRHKQIHTGEREFECETCGKAFLRKSQLTKHYSMHVLDRDHKCEICGKGFISKDQLQRHVTLHYSNRSHKCELCGKGFNQKAHLARHLYLLHSTNDNLECKLCALCFTTSDELSKHLLSHCTYEEHKCELCGKGFVDDYQLKKHMLRHQGEGEHKCEVCGKCFPQKRYLSRHLTVHGDEVSNKCRICGKYFTEKKFLVRHQMLHSTNQSHRCDVCGKRYHQKRYLSRHLILHTAVGKTHRCEICGNGFLQESYLIRHYMIIHHLKKNHKCVICGKMFLNEDYLASHVLEHTKTKIIPQILIKNEEGDITKQEKSALHVTDNGSEIICTNGIKIKTEMPFINVTDIDGNEIPLRNATCFKNNEVTNNIMHLENNITYLENRTSESMADPETIT